MAGIAVLFPGQGSQEKDMGRDIAEKDKDIMELWKKAEKLSKLELREVYWGTDEQAMSNTKYLQPALTLANTALWLNLKKYCNPIATAGHSLGEYSSLIASEVLSFDKVIELVSLRGKLMSAADPDGKGAMAAVLKLSIEKIEECIKKTKNQINETLTIANYNTPEQTVVSGTKTAIASFINEVKEAKGRAILLPVSGAFHSELMEDANKEMNLAINSIPANNWNDPKFPVYCNTIGLAINNAKEIKEHLSKQMTSSVYWTKTICSQWKDGVSTFIECGPKGALSRMIDPTLNTCKQSDCDQWRTIHIGSLQQLEEFSIN